MRHIVKDDPLLVGLVVFGTVGGAFLLWAGQAASAGLTIAMVIGLVFMDRAME